MRKTTVAAVIILVTAAVYAQKMADANTQENHLVALEKMWNQAQLMRDAPGIERLIAARFSNTEWDGEVSDRQKFLADIRDPQFQPATLGISDVKVTIIRDTAIVTGTYHAKGTYNEKGYDHVGRFTDTWIYSDDRWQCIASHTSLIKK